MENRDVGGYEKSLRRGLDSCINTNIYKTSFKTHCLED
jgi:hypothetical protein